MITVAVFALTFLGDQGGSRLRKLLTDYVPRANAPALGESLWRPVVSKDDAKVDGLVDVAKKVESRLKQVIATVIKPASDLDGECGVEVELLRSGTILDVAAR